MSKKIIDMLWTFCARAGDTRPYVQQPIADKQYAYATNGRALVCVPIAKVRGHKITSIRDNWPRPVRNLRKMIDERKAASGDLIEIPELPCAILCDVCDGSGHVAPFQYCEDCGGSGEKLHNPASVGITYINRRCLALIATLPGAKIATPREACMSVYFTSDITDGVVMPTLP
jgi:hypothetical protein